MSVAKNNFGCLRLCLASAVIIGHEPEFIDGNRHHEPLTMLFHTMSLGEAAVNCFFLISGFLIARSALTTTRAEYLSNRLRRILPGYVVAYLLCAFVLAPFVGGNPWGHLPKIVGKFLFLSTPPYFPGLLASIKFGNLDSSMWTIAYELRCYLVLLALVSLGVLQRRRTMLVITASLVVAYIAKLSFDPNWRMEDFDNGVPWWFVGIPTHDLRFLSTFLVGSCFYLYWPEVSRWLSAQVALACAAVLAMLMFNPLLANPAMAVFGGPVLLWLAMKADFGPLQKINDRWDISYGVYLYGWPTAMTLLYFNRQASAWVLTPVSLLVAMMLGAISWFVIEKPMRRAKVSAPDSVGIELRRAA